MDMDELGFVLAGSIFVGFVFLILLKDAFSGFFVDILIDTAEFSVIQIDSAMPVQELSEWADVQNGYSSGIPLFFGIIRFTAGFASVFGSYVCIKTFFVRWF